MPSSRNKKKQKNLSKTRKQTNTGICLDYFKSILDGKHELQNIKNVDIAQHLIPVSKDFDPKKDFYTYINYGWLSKEKNVKEDKYYTQIDNFRTVQEKVNFELMDIVDEYIKTKHTHKSKNIEALYNSILHDDTRILKGHIEKSMNDIDHLVDSGTLLDLLAHLNTNEIISWQSPVSFIVDIDEKNVAACRAKVNEPQLSIYDYTIYVADPNDNSEDGKFKRDFKDKYLSFIEELFHQCLGAHHGLDAADIWEIENIMLDAMGCDTSDSTEYYSKVSTAKSSEYGLDWKTFSKKVGFDYTPSFYISGNPDYLSCIMKELTKNWKTKKWITYYKYMYLKQMIMFDPKMYVLYYDFFKHYVEGSQEILPKRLRPIIPMSLCYNEFLTDEYVERNEDKDTLKMVEILCNDLLSVFKDTIRKNNWLSPSTKKYALLKLQKIYLILSRPKKIQSDPNISYDPKDVWGNMLKITKWRYNEMLKREGKPTIEYSRIDWSSFKMTGKQSYIVNAFYTPSENNICVPLAYLQKPFIDISVSGGIERLLSTIGCTVAHEMSHSLDDMGSKYDYKGNMKNWWTPGDRKKFNEKIKDVVNQYETVAARDGIKLDGTLSTGENLADISGLAICTKYLHLYHKLKQYPEQLSFLSYKMFYVYVAIDNRQKIYKNALKSQLKINPHPFNKYRTNCPLARIKNFVGLWNIKEKDNMYWHNTDIIW